MYRMILDCYTATMVHLVCFKCGMYGHKKDSCPLEKNEPTAPPEAMVGEEGGKTSASIAKNHATEEESLINPGFKKSAESGTT